MEGEIKRNPVLACIFSFLMPGLGQLYNGQLIKGAILYIVPLLLLIIFSLLGLDNYFISLIIFLFLLLCFLLYILFDAVKNAKLFKDTSLKKYNKWYIYIILLMLHIFLLTPLYSSIITIKSYKMPAGSMEPTVLAKEYFFIKKNYYNNRKPNRGDVIIFATNENDKRYLKRCIAIEGDNLQIKENSVFINGKKIIESYTQGATSYNGFGEKIIEGVVPKDNVVVLGDNRENSYDSRGFGYLPLSRIEGKALYIYWSDIINRIGLQIK